MSAKVTWNSAIFGCNDMVNMVGRLPPITGCLPRYDRLMRRWRPIQVVELRQRWSSLSGLKMGRLKPSWRVRREQ